jgi:microcystin degradation protein MlrC
MRIAIGQLWQETNTFNPLPTLREHFEPFGIDYGDELVEKMADVNELGGFIQELRAWPEKPQIVGLARFLAWPSGPVKAAVIDEFFAQMVDRLRRAMPVDAVLLSLHGSMVAEHRPDVEGDLLEQVRRLVGANVPVVSTLDLHVNLTRKMVDNADALVLYHTAPHIDVFDTGRRGARVLRRILIDRVKPAVAFQKIPMVVPAERANTQDSASVSFGFREFLQKCEADPRILSAGLATVQPWLDIPEMGSAVIVTTVGDAELARSRCAELASQVWQRRRDYLPELVDVADAVKQAHEQKDGLVVLGDAADSTNSGSTGEGTAILSELVRYDWPRPALTTFVDAELVAQAARQGVGAKWKTSLGGKIEQRFSKPLALNAEVEKLFDAKFILSGHLGRNMPIDLGAATVLKHGNVHIIVTSRSGPLFAAQLFQTAGFDPFAASVLVAKSPCGFRAAYQERAKRIIMVRSPGCAPSDFWNYEYRRIPRPIWPWDDTMDWKPPDLV